ncbi:Rv2578c family radical SAM protein [Nonomuraea mangrovi]|uniref:Rv2578c family radical SAM protein n=1 Tax=Nonomuraea mangrovi TaxID=2316207 RepID=A0ABW4SKT1_9ACTN
MRWDNLRLTDADGDESAVPLFARGAVARTFDTPEFKGMTFYEIQARSIINKVPAASRVPFSYTINPYRGCSHSCTYCLVGDTPVLMADGSLKPIADLRPGDPIIGTEVTGEGRRYVVTEVLDHWRTVKPAYRVTLADGTTLVTSGDHRFLATGGRGWRHVAAACPAQAEANGPAQATAHPSTWVSADVPEEGNGPGQATAHPSTWVSADVREKGNGPGRVAAHPSTWVSADVREEGNGPAEANGPGQVAADGGRPVLTVDDTLVGLGRFVEAPKRDDDYMRGHLAATARDARATPCIGDAATSYEKAAAKGDEGPDASGMVGSTRTAKSMRTPKGAATAESARIPSPEWAKGFLAGAFDRHGPGLGFSGGDEDLVGWCLDELGLVPPALAGGPGERLRFLHTVGPATAWEPDVEGAEVTSTAGLRVVSIEPLGVDLPMFDITTGTGDFVADGVVSHNCFARKTHEYLDLDAGHDFDSKIVVKVNAAELARKELAAPRWGGEHVAMGTNVDCYQRAEGRYQLMPGILRALGEAANPFSVLTKGTLILRDLPLLVEAARVTEVSAAVSVGFLDEGLWRAVEPGTPNPRRRLEVCRRLNDSGIACGVLMAPILPYLSDAPEQLEETVGQIAAAGATHVAPIVLHLRPGAREWFLGWLSREHPRLVPRYLELYGRGAYAPKAYQDRVTEHVRRLAKHFGIGRSPSWRIKPDKAPQPEQLSLL